MEIPQRCFCGAPVAAKLLAFWKHVPAGSDEDFRLQTGDAMVRGFRTDAGRVMDELGADQLCCRRTLLTSLRPEWLTARK